MAVLRQHDRRCPDLNRIRCDLSHPIHIKFFVSAMRRYGCRSHELKRIRCEFSYLVHVKSRAYQQCDKLIGVVGILITSLMNVFR